MVQQGNERLVSRGREIKSTSGGFKKLGKSISKPLDRFSKDGILRYIISLPLNSIPGIGTALFLTYNGWSSPVYISLDYLTLDIDCRREGWTPVSCTVLSAA